MQPASHHIHARPTNAERCRICDGLGRGGRGPEPAVISSPPGRSRQASAGRATKCRPTRARSVVERGPPRRSRAEFTRWRSPKPVHRDHRHRSIAITDTGPSRSPELVRGRDQARRHVSARSRSWWGRCFGALREQRDADGATVHAGRFRWWTRPRRSLESTPHRCIPGDARGCMSSPGTSRSLRPIGSASPGFRSPRPSVCRSRALRSSSTEPPTRNRSGRRSCGHTARDNSNRCRSELVNLRCDLRPCAPVGTGELVSDPAPSHRLGRNW